MLAESEPRRLLMKGPVVCGIEDPSSIGAVKVAGELARCHDLPLLYVHVVDERPNEQAIELRHEPAPVPGDFLMIRSHHPADCLLAIARERRASFFVVGNHGPRSSLLGSISADLARRAPCPVVVVPTTAEAADEHAAGSEVRLAGGLLRLPPQNGAVRRAA
jgi:nucleotide-binding universal stress UspA family protein